MSAFDLTKNSFALLNATPRSNRDQIEDLFHDSLLESDDHESEMVVNLARQNLTSPRERLDIELQFFLHAKPTKIKEVIGYLRKGLVSDNLDEFFGVDFLNLRAHFCRIGNTRERLTHAKELINAYEAIDIAETLDAINASRVISGFGRVEPEQLKSAIGRLRLLHAQAALDAILEIDQGVDYLATLAEDLANNARAKTSLVETLLQEYETRIAPELEAGAAKVLQRLADVDADPGNLDLVHALAADLRAWDRLAQPLQNADRAKGIDERHSRQLFDEIRTVCLSLANERGLYREALGICQIAAEVFQELPGAARKLAEDIEALSNLSAQKAKQDLLIPLDQAVSDANERRTKTCAGLRKSGFNGDAPSPVKEIYSAFASLTRSSNDIELIGMGARLVRDLGIGLCNDSNDNHAALLIVEGLLKHRSLLPVDVVKALEDDYATLQRNIDFDAMNEALKRGQLNEADSLAAGLLERTDGDTHSTLIGVRRQIAKRKKARHDSFIGWGVIAAFALVVFVLNVGSNSTPSDDYDSRDYDYSDVSEVDTYADATDAAAESAEEAVGEVAEAAEAAEAATEENVPAYSSGFLSESPPSPYQSYGVLTLAELRYCRRQSARLDEAQYAQMSNPQIDRFNAAIEDYNSRCSSFRYDQSDMDRVDSEIANDQATIRSEALGIIGNGQ